MMIMMMMMMIIVIIIIIIIIVALKGAIRDFYNLLTAPRTVSNTYAQVARAQSFANHVQHIERLSRATCRVTCHVVRRDSSEIEFKRVEIAFIWKLYRAQKETHIFMSLILCNIWSFEIYNKTPQHENLFLEDTCVMWAANKWLTLSVWVSYNCFTLYGACFSQTVRY